MVRITCLSAYYGWNNNFSFDHFFYLVSMAVPKQIILSSAIANRHELAALMA